MNPHSWHMFIGSCTWYFESCSGNTERPFGFSQSKDPSLGAKQPNHFHANSHSAVLELLSSCTFTIFEERECDYWGPHLPNCARSVSVDPLIFLKNSFNLEYFNLLSHATMLFQVNTFAQFKPLCRTNLNIV